MRQCAECKGKGLCGLPRCPIVSRFHAQAALKPVSSYQGSAPSVFIGSSGYPAIRGGPLLINDSDHPPDWIRQNLGIDEIVGIRARTIRGRAALQAVDGSLQEIALSSSPLEVAVQFDRPVSFLPDFDGTVAPIGLSGTVTKLDLLGNAKVSRSVDRITSDTDVSATDAALVLNRDGTDVYRIATLMTAGLLGRRRRFVPTRWAITAVDDTISTGMKKNIARFSPLNEYLVFSKELFGNRITVILAPGDWRYEMLEIWGAHTLWAGDEEMIVQDREGMVKRAYSPVSGAYYAARLAVCEYLESIRCSARALIIRNVSDQYWAPLGVWVVREAARSAMASVPVSCATLDEAVSRASVLSGSGTWLSHSTLIPELRSQRTLLQF